MLTLQHTALYLMALADKKTQIEKEFHDEIPFVLLPDAIRAYMGQRAISHFENSIDQKDYSWIVFPTEEVLKQLKMETVVNSIQHYLVPNIPKCEVGGTTNLQAFISKNKNHKHYRSLYIHLLQDSVTDSIIRNDFVDTTDKLSDRYFLRNDMQRCINGEALRSQFTIFENLGYIKLICKVYEHTGILINRGWLDKYVFTALSDAYPMDLAVKTYSYMLISDELEKRINNREFGLTRYELASIYITDKTEEIIERMYADAYEKTIAQI